MEEKEPDFIGSVPGFGSISGGAGGIDFSASAESRGEQGGSSTGNKVFNGQQDNMMGIILLSLVGIGVIVWISKN